MENDTIQRLLDLNRQFYQTFAVDFSATRQRLQPGVQRIIADLPRDANLLDLGCGNGELWRVLAARGHTGQYLGLDFSPGLLAVARQAAGKPPGPGQATFLQADLSRPDWECPVQELIAGWPGFQGFDAVLSFAVLHHLPGKELRGAVLQHVRALLAPGGRFIHSEWQFLNSPRLRLRIHDWTEAGIAPQDVDPGDYLLDWRRGGQGLRYAHHFDLQELDSLAADCGFEIIDTFQSDGEGGALGLYQTWKLN